MKTGRFLLALTTCLLLMRAISHADDQQRNLPGAGLSYGKSVSNRTLHVPQPVIVPIVKPSPATSRNHGLATIGGPAKTSRSAGVINGTNMKRKP
jgi:hypothetical protein